MYCLSPKDMPNVNKRLLAELHQSFVQKHLHCVSGSRLLLFELRGSRERWRWQNGTASVDRSSGLAKPTLTYGIYSRRSIRFWGVGDEAIQCLNVSSPNNSERLPLIQLRGKRTRSHAYIHEHTILQAWETGKAIRLLFCSPMKGVRHLRLGGGIHDRTWVAFLGLQ